MTATRCSVCGGPSHPRLILRQAAHVPPRRPWWPSVLVGAFVLGIALLNGLIGGVR